MEAELWHRIEELFEKALQQPAENRAEFLRNACGGDVQLQNEVETLLENAGENGSFLQDSPLAGAALVKGQKLGNFEILEPIGSGGMGEVYRARDSRLKRDVAIKVLPRAFARDAERLARFEREARAASALNHPNIVCVYDIGRADDTAWIASELVEGQSLRQLLAKGALPLRRVIDIARQIADGLAAAHATGLVHRDLKPENVMLARDGRVKILDFGLAKRSLGAASGGPASATITRPGMISGTPGYMSPEQIAGRTVDQRSDIFSLGVVTYEMLAGRRPFAGDTSVAVMNAVLTDEPEQLRVEIPTAVARLVQHCLEKEPEHRLQSAADFSFALLLQIGERARAPERGRRLAWSVLAIALSCLGAIALLLWRQNQVPTSSPPLVLTRMTTDAGLTTDPALSPDGKLLAYASDRSGEGNLDIWVQQTAGGAPIRLTRNEADDSQPDFSPDGSLIAFRSERSGGGIYVISALGGGERLIAPDGLRPRFSPDGKEIAYFVGDLGDVFSRNTGKVFIVSSTGGSPRQFQPGFVAARFPVWSPDGRYILFIGTEGGTRLVDLWDWYVAGVSGGPAVRTGAARAIATQTLLDSSFVIPLAWIPAGDRVLFASTLGDAINLWQLRIPNKTWKINDPPHRLTSGAGLETLAAVAGNRLAFISAAQNVSIWTLDVDADRGEVHGALQRATEGPSSDDATDISLDGKKAVFNSNRIGRNAVWIKDFESGKETMVSGRGQSVGIARITADGSRVGYPVGEGTKAPLYTVPASGGMPEQVCDDRCGSFWNWSGDGKKVLYVWRSTRDLTEIFLFDAESKKTFPILQTPEFNLYMPSFSPDGRWVAFHARTPKEPLQQYVAPFRGERPIPVNEWIEVGKGEDLHWSPDGTALYSMAHLDGFKCLWMQRVHPRQQKTNRTTGLYPAFSSSANKLGEFGGSPPSNSFELE